MSSQPQTAAQAQPATTAKRSIADFQPKSVDYEDALSSAKCKERWAKFYKASSLSGEDKQMSARAGSYLYSLINGTSREGGYAGSFTIYDGTVVDAANLPRSIGKMELRKFFRGNMAESYESLKGADLSTLAPRLVAKCATIGIGATEVFAVADWMDDCPQFTPAENLAHEKYKQYSLQRAARARGGQSLESVENSRVRASLSAQGPAQEAGGVDIEF